MNAKEALKLVSDMVDAVAAKVPDAKKILSSAADLQKKIDKAGDGEEMVIPTANVSGKGIWTSFGVNPGLSSFQLQVSPGKGKPAKTTRLPLKASSEAKVLAAVEEVLGGGGKKKTEKKASTEYSYARVEASEDVTAADITPARLDELATAFAHFVSGHRPMALDQIKYLARVLPDDMMVGGEEGQAQLQGLKAMFLMAMKRHVK